MSAQRRHLCIGGVTWLPTIYRDGEPTQLIAFHHGVWWMLERTKRRPCVLSFTWMLALPSGKHCPMVVRCHARDFDDAFTVVSTTNVAKVRQLADIEEARIGEHLKLLAEDDG